MELHEIISVAETEEDGVYIATVDITDMSGERYETDYVSRAGDIFGLAPTIRYAVEAWIADGKPVLPYEPPPPPPVDLYAYARQKRYEVETGGVMFNGVLIRTDPDSQARITGAYTLLQADPTLTEVDWEAQPQQWVTVDADTMKAIGIAVGRHVQACFSTLRAVQAAIAAGTITTTAEIDAAGWPA